MKHRTDHCREFCRILPRFDLVYDLRPFGIRGYSNKEGWFSQVLYKSQGVCYLI
jgi:hypothetical protein